MKPDVEAHMLFGWWKILSFQVEFEDAGERADTYGVNPLGHKLPCHRQLGDERLARLDDLVSCHLYR